MRLLLSEPASRPNTTLLSAPFAGCAPSLTRRAESLLAPRVRCPEERSKAGERASGEHARAAASAGVGTCVGRATCSRNTPWTSSRSSAPPARTASGSIPASGPSFQAVARIFVSHARSAARTVRQPIGHVRCGPNDSCRSGTLADGAWICTRQESKLLSVLSSACRSSSGMCAARSWIERSGERQSVRNRKAWPVPRLECHHAFSRPMTASVSNNPQPF